MLFFGMFPVYVLSSDDEELARSREERPLTWRFVLCSLLAGVALVTALAFFVHHFVWPVQVVGDVERWVTWRENVNTVTVRGYDGSDLYELSGNCYAERAGDKVAADGVTRPGPAVVTCRDKDVMTYTRILDGMSFTVDNTGSSYVWEEARATIREAGSSVSYSLSDYRGLSGN